MEELNQFLNSVESSARKILKQQNKKQQELLARDRVAQVRNAAGRGSSSPAKTAAVSRDELRVAYAGNSGALIVSAPSPSRAPDSPSRRSEHSSESELSLPRILAGGGSAMGADPSRANASTAVDDGFLPAIQTKQQSVGKEAAIATRERRMASSMKLLQSPLYKSLAKATSEPGLVPSSSPASIKKALHEVDNVSLLLRKIGLKTGANGPNSPLRLRPDHAVEKRMCNACWAQPTKLTGCEHHPVRALKPSNQQTIELQGPTSWLSTDLYVKYRSESDREALWTAFIRLRDGEDHGTEDEEAQHPPEPEVVRVIPLVTRHPIYEKLFTQIHLENLTTQAETRKRNQSKAFIFDVNHIWLTNLDHFNVRLARRQKKSDPDDLDEDGSGCFANELSDRRDEAAIRQGYSQIQSISTARALQNAVFPDLDPVAERNNQSASTNEEQGLRRRRPRTSGGAGYPLSLLVCGRWNPESRALDMVPGVAVISTRRVLWWQYEHDPVEHTKTVAMFARSAKLSSSNAILVSMLIALDAPLQPPIWFAWCLGSKFPPPAPVIPSPTDVPWLGLPPPRNMSPCLQTPLTPRLISRLDSLLPCTTVVLNTIAEPDDHVLGLDEPYGHRRFWQIANEDAFRQLWHVHQDVLYPNYDVDSQPCNVQVAQTNATGVTIRACWHSIDVIDGHICRRRLERDFLYVLQNHMPNCSGDPMYFVVAMAHEAVRDVHVKKLSAYLAVLDERRRKQEYEAKMIEIEQKIEQGRLLLAAKQEEQKRLQEQTAAADAQRADRSRDKLYDEPVLREWQQRLGESIVLEAQCDWQLRELAVDDTSVVFYHCSNAGVPALQRFSWERPAAWIASSSGLEEQEAGSITDRSIASDKSAVVSTVVVRNENDALIAQLTSKLLEDEHFVDVLRAKLGILPPKEDTHRARLRSSQSTTSTGEQETEDTQVDWNDQLLLAMEEPDRSRASLMVTKMAKLQLKPQTTLTRPKAPGEGWKRLKVTRLPKNFARSVYSRHTEGGRASFINQTNHATPVGMIDPKESSPYELPDFIPEFKAVLIPKANADLQEKKAQWHEYELTKASAVNSPPASKNVAPSAKDALFERDPLESEMTLEQRAAKAVLCARNNNLAGVRGCGVGCCCVESVELMRACSCSWKLRWTTAWT